VWAGWLYGGFLSCAVLPERKASETHSHSMGYSQPWVIETLIQHQRNKVATKHAAKHSPRPIHPLNGCAYNGCVGWISDRARAAVRVRQGRGVHFHSIHLPPSLPPPALPRHSPAIDATAEMVSNATMQSSERERGGTTHNSHDVHSPSR